jgi:hypothetical protein
MITDAGLSFHHEDITFYTGFKEESGLGYVREG